VTIDRVKPLKIESIASGGDENDEYPSSLNPEEDHVECAGLVLDAPGLIDESTVLDRNGNDMRFKDTNNPVPVTLSTIVAGATGVTYNEFLLDNEPTAETGASDCAYTITRAAGQVTKEEWKRNDTTLIKSIDYSYITGKLSSEVRKVFAANGSTIVAQVTWSYTYTGGLLTSAAMIRDV